MFLAVGLDERSRLHLSHELRTAFPSGLPGRQVRPDDWHITLRFMPKIDQVTMERFVAHLDQRELGGGFTLRLGGIGAFPRARRAQVAWLGVESGTERLVELAAHAEDAAVAVGLAPEERPFRPHLTLTRIRPAADLTGFTEASVGVSVRVQHVTLFETVFGSGGARYHERAEVRL